ncbi:MAG: hypothetical protein AB7O24_17035 [Kofleriaceae bacterium]
MGRAQVGAARDDVKARARRHLRRPPDLTSLFDVLFIVVFAALIRAAAAQQALAAATAPAPPKPAPATPITPPDVAALRAHALASLQTDLAARTPLVIRISATGTVEALELADKRMPLDVPLLEHDPNPDVGISYLGERSAELRVCRIATVHLGLPDLSRHLVIIAPVIALADLSHALFEGLHRDLDRCLAEQRGLASLVDPSELAAPTTPAPSSAEPSP